MKQFLMAMEYPCTRDDLVREARRAGLMEEADALQLLPDDLFDGSPAVLAELPPLAERDIAAKRARRRQNQHSGVAQGTMLTW